MGDPNRISEGCEPQVVGSAASGPWGGASVWSFKAGAVMLVDVEGELDAPALTSWWDLLNSAITGGATGITVDLRGCRVIDIGCISVLVAASGRLTRRGDGGINLVTIPGSSMERRLRPSATKGLPGYSSAGEALRSLREAA